MFLQKDYIIMITIVSVELYYANNQESLNTHEKLCLQKLMSTLFIRQLAIRCNGLLCYYEIDCVKKRWRLSLLSSEM